MEFALVILRQTLIMAIYMLAGFVLFKKEKITAEGSRTLAGLLVWLVIPLVIVNGFSVPFSYEKLKGLGVSAVLAVISLGLSMLLSRLFFKSAPIDNFGCAFSNCGFIGIPLVRAALGEDAVFYTVSYVALLNILQFTYGVALLKNNRGKPRLKEALGNPFVIATAAGLVLFLTGWGVKLPPVLGGAIKGITALNSPLAMIVLGVYLAQTKVGELFITPRLYGVSAVRLIIIPLVTLPLLTFSGADSAVKYAVLFCCAAPVGANVAVYAQLYGADYPYACKTVALSTILSILSLPALAALAGLIPLF